MTEPTITCPNCKTEIKLTESLAAPLIESTRQQFEQQLAQKDSDIAQREQAVRDKETQLAETKTRLDEQVADQVEVQLKKDRARIISEEARKAKLAVSTDLEEKARELVDLQEVLKIRDEKLAEAQKAQAELIRKQRELDDARREMDLTVEKRVQEGLTETREQARKEAEEGLNQYLTGPRFRQRVEAIVEAFSTMQADLDKERKVIMKQWAKRDEQINRVMQATVGMYGDLQGIAGKTLQEIEGLDWFVAVLFVSSAMHLPISRWKRSPMRCSTAANSAGMITAWKS